MAKVGTSNPDRTISLKRLRCVVQNNNTILTLNQVPRPKTLTWKKMEIVVLCGIRLPVETSIEKMEATKKIKNICLGQPPNSVDLPYNFTKPLG